MPFDKRPKHTDSDMDMDMDMEDDVLGFDDLGDEPNADIEKDFEDIDRLQ